MIVECDHCHAKYHYDEERFAGKPSKKLRCSKCQGIFEVVNTRAYEAGPPVRPPIASGETHLRRPKTDTPTPKPVAATPHPRAPRAPRLPEDQKLSLAVIAGPDAGKMYAIDKPRVVIGREEVDFALDDPEISRQHAAIEVSGANVFVLDLNSTNGTFVDENAVTEAPLENQDEFTIGGSTIMLIVTSSP
jgi:S-DNA-T family DNA segregation ATPase FtsK/SpoIIIE